MPENLRHLEHRLQQSRELAENASDVSVRLSHQEMSKRYVERIATAKARISSLPPITL
jgi:hypothetical protein